MPRAHKINYVIDNGWYDYLILDIEDGDYINFTKANKCFIDYSAVDDN